MMTLSERFRITQDGLSTALVNYRLPLILSFTILTTFIGYFFSLCLRFEFAFEEILLPNRIILPALLLIVYRLGAYTYFRLNEGYWRYSSTYDLIRIVKAHAISSLLLTATILMLRVPHFPRSVIAIEFALSILLAGGSRLLVRLWCERFLSKHALNQNGQSRDVIVIGAGNSGHLLIKNLISQPRFSYKPVAVLDDGERLEGASVHGVRVEGPVSKLGDCLQAMPTIAAVIVAIPSLSQPKLKAIEMVCQRFNVPVKRLQAFEDIACLDAQIAQNSLTIESVLEKEIDIEHEQEIRQVLCGKRILVTGAGGSIGSELVRQIAAFGPARVIMVDSCEFNLYRIERETGQNFPNIRHSAVLGNICDEARMLEVFSEYKPDYVFHAAAYKHVPLLENNANEAFKNNVLGTRNLLNYATHFGAKRFVFISTDKAVDPSSIMGCTKRLAEKLVQYASSDVENGLHTAIVRFGNVINSAGSVVPLFKEQILSGGPITVTHPEMERYFMSIREAVRLVLTAGTLGSSGEVYLLSMGNPIKIVDVARKMRALYGRRDIPIVYTGVRPGEKLKEELLCDDEKTVPTSFKKVNRVMQTSKFEDLGRWVAELEDRLGQLSSAEVGSILRDFVGNQVANQPRVNGGALDSGQDRDKKVGLLG